MVPATTHDQGATVRHDERGEIITGWLLRILLTVAVLGLVIYEVLAVVVSTVALDDNAREVARAARDAYRVEQSVDDATEVAQEVADLHDADVTALEEDGEDLVITLDQQAPTLLVHRIGPLEDLTRVTVTRRVAWQP